MITIDSPRKQIGRKTGFPKLLVFLFLVFALYMVLPLIDVPLLGLSLSAPIFFFIAVNSVFKPPKPWPQALQKWIIIAVFIWIGIFISTMMNGLISEGVKIDNEGLKLLIQNAYWLLTFIVVAYFASQQEILKRTSEILGWAVFVLAMVRLFEAIVWGIIGSEVASTRFLTPNAYGFIFSTFFPYLLVPMFNKKEKRRLIMILRILIAGVAVAINGSRSSWISVAVGILFFSFLLIITKPRKTGLVIITIAFSALVVFGLQLAPSNVTSAVSQRFGTFENLEQDKSFVFRQMMVQKGLKLFKESPVIGVGASRFRKESVQLELTGVFSLYSQSKFDHKSSHNSYIGFLAETGMVGSIPLLILLLSLGIQGLQASLQQVRQEQIWAIGVITSFLGMSIHMWTISALAGTSTWFVYGLVAALIIYNRSHSVKVSSHK